MSNQPPDGLEGLARYVASISGAEIRHVDHVGSPDMCSVPVLVAPPGVTASSIKNILDQYLVRPEYMVGTSRHETLESLIAHANAHDTGKGAFFVSVSERRVDAVYDYHVGSRDYVPADNGDLKEDWSNTAPEPHWRQHRALYEFPVDSAWKRWTGADRKRLPMAEFAEFIDENIRDILPPPDLGGDNLSEADQRLADLQRLIAGRWGGPERLMEVSKKFSIHETNMASIGLNRDTGELSMAFKEEHDGAQVGQVSVPNLFAIAIPVHQHGPRYRIAARLRYRKANGITFWFELQDLEWVTQAAYDDAIRRLRTETNMPVFCGTPETPHC